MDLTESTKIIVMLLVGVVIAFTIGANVINDSVSAANLATSSISVANESWTGVAYTAHNLAYAPLTTINEMYIRNGSTATNNVQGIFNQSLWKSLSTNAIWPTGTANLTIECNLTAAELATVSVMGTLLSNISYCPVTFTNVSQSALGDPSTIISFVGTGTQKVDLLYNGTAISTGSGTHLLDRTYTPKAGINSNVTINATLIDSESIAVYVNGTLIGNSSGADTWTGGYGLTNPVNITYVNTLWMKTMLAANSTVLTANGSIYDNVVIPTKACAASPGVNITVTYQMNAGENITYRFEGHAMGNLSGVGVDTFDPDPGWECDLASLTTIRSSFETTDVGHLTKTNITGVNISYDRWTNASTVTGAAVRYAYQAYDSNFTNATLAYNRYSAFGSANYNTSATAGSITPDRAGVFMTSYDSINPNTIGAMIGSFLTILFVAGVCIILFGYALSLGGIKLI